MGNNTIKKELLIPSRFTIETVFGCNAHCPMCVIDLPTKRKKGIMPLEMSNKIMDQMAPYAEHIQQMDLFELGEPLIDPYIFERIKYAKSKGFKSVGISTNADLLDQEKQKKLLESGIDTVLFSLDGIKKETHEKIRRGVKFERVMENVQNIIRMRNEGNYNTRFVIRFVKQDINENEWEDLKNFWLPKLSKEKNDLLICYDKHTFGGETSSKEELLKDRIDAIIEKKPCHRINELLIILADGSVPLCNEDVLHCKYNFGNVKDKHPIQIFNSPKFNRIRKIHAAGKKSTLEVCKDCTILYSELTRIDLKPES